MDAKSPRWIEITPSRYPWEREALVFVREHLPDHEPYRAWSNFEFVAGDGSINEVDLLVLTPKGFFLVEIKSRPGNVDGDAGTWTWASEGKRFTDDSPLILANRKAKKLIDLLRSQHALHRTRTPFLEAHVFLSAADVRIRLPDVVRAKVHHRDRELEGSGRLEGGVIEALTRWNDANAPRMRIDRPFARALTRAMEQAGIRPSQRARRVGDYQLDELLYEGPSYQDWAATHVALEKQRARVRIYVIEPGASEETKISIARAAKREFQILNGIEHPGILRANAYTEHDRGPALVFEHLPGSQRLDHFLAERGERLSVDLRLDLLRQIAEAVSYAHEKRLYHRALSPQNVLVVDPAARCPRLKVFNWQTGAREPTRTGGTLFGVTATSHLSTFVAEESAVYIAPEALSEHAEAGEQADVFSLGALAYRLFSGQPPARSFFELAEKLREDKGLLISSVLDGAATTLEYLIRFSTHPEVTARLDSVADFLDELEKFEDEITTPDPEPDVVTDPTLAKPGDRLPEGFVMRRRLGKGASSLVLLVERDGKEAVLKIALDATHNKRLRAEAAILSRLRRHQYVIALDETLTIGGRVALLMERAGDKTLAERIREEGRLHPELLERFGEDLLEVVKWLEDEGVAHRDIKPENLGVVPMGRGDPLHLVLFDFSLANTRPENIHAGTRHYLDPFLALRKPPRWDSYAERFAAAVTLYQMATGGLPKWGDGRSEPAVLDCEATLDVNAFEPALRESMSSFFSKALRRDYRQRFDNAREMLLAWREIFSAADRPEVSTDHGAEARPVTAIEDAVLDTQLSELGLSTRALNAVERVNLRTVEDLLRFPLGRLRRLRGVGSKTRRELVELLKLIETRFPEAAAAPKQIPREAGPETPPDSEIASIDELAGTLLAKGKTGGPKGETDLLKFMLGLGAEPAPAGDEWPSRGRVARRLGVTHAAVSRALERACKRWLKNPAMTHLRDDIAGLLESQAGVMIAAELTAALLASRGSDQSEPIRDQRARAVVRAALELEGARAQPRWIVRRFSGGARLLIARDETGADGSVILDGERLADYAEALGRCADALAQEDPLRPSARALGALQAVPSPESAAAPDTARLIQLAVAVSEGAALSSRLEIYPRAMPAERALKLALGALSGAPEFTAEEVRERVAGRYPAAAPLPERPALDKLLEAAGSGLRWRATAQGGCGAYVAPLREFTTVTTATSLARTLTPAFDEVPEERLAAEAFERRLEQSVEDRDFLVLVVPPRDAVRAAAALAARFPVEVRSLDALLIGHMRRFAEEKRIDWPVVLSADGVASKERSRSHDWSNLQRVVTAVLPRVQSDLAAAESHVLLADPGLLARYRRIDLINDLRQERSIRDGPTGLWVLISSDGQQRQPTLDGVPVPVFTAAQWARVPAGWVWANQPAMETREAAGG